MKFKMIFDKANEYLFQIFSNQDTPSELKILGNSGNANTLGGFLNNGDAYLLVNGNNKVGLRINNGKYSFIQKREKITNSHEFNEIFEYDEMFSEEDLREAFKDVDFVEFIEEDKDNNSSIKLSYLVNKSTYILYDYFNQFSKTDYNSASLKINHINAVDFIKLGLLTPTNDDFNIQNKQNNILLVPDSHHKLYDISFNEQELESELLRKSFIDKIYASILEADKNSYIFNEDFSCCIDSAKKSVDNQNLAKDLDER